MVGGGGGGRVEMEMFFVLGVDVRYKSPLFDNSCIGNTYLFAILT